MSKRYARYGNRRLARLSREARSFGDLPKKLCRAVSVTLSSMVNYCVTE